MACSSSCATWKRVSGALGPGHWGWGCADLQRRARGVLPRLLQRGHAALHRLPGLAELPLLQQHLPEVEVRLDEARVRPDGLPRVRRSLAPHPLRLVDGGSVREVDRRRGAVEVDGQGVELDRLVVLRSLEARVPALLELAEQRRSQRDEVRLRARRGRVVGGSAAERGGGAE